MYSRKIALSLAKQFRRCPPSEILKDSSQKTAFERHRKICPYCAVEKGENQSTWDQLVDRMQRLYPSAKTDATDEKTPLEAGQIRTLKSNGVWRDNYFYRPPMVFVVEKTKTLPGAVLVAQIYHDTQMAAPGDLILSEEDTAIGPLFVECWNIYSLQRSLLGPPLDAVSDAIVDAVQTCKHQPEYFPEWGPMPRPMVENDSRIFFRELELEVAYTFSARSVSKIVAEYEKRSSRRFNFAPEEARDMICRAAPGTVWKRMPTSFEEIFAMAALPVEDLPLAAAEKSREQKTANLVCVTGSKVVSVSPVPMEMHGQSGDLVLSGRVRGLPVAFLWSRFICFIETEGESIAPQRCEWNADTGDFMARFPDSPEQEWNLKAAVVIETEE